LTTFQSSAHINKPIDQVYAFLADLNNHGKLMATDDVSDWSSTMDEASFTIRNMLKLSLKVEERLVDEMIRIVPAEKPPFDMELKWELSADGEHNTDVVFTITADLNMMMKMLASGPLQKLADDESANLFNLLQ
jgi:carbon monoxide dehydrogenase subunit G